MIKNNKRQTIHNQCCYMGHIVSTVYNQIDRQVYGQIWTFAIDEMTIEVIKQIKSQISQINQNTEI